MTSIGDPLRRERLRRNLELRSIAEELKISARFLEAIEAEDFGKLPGGVFTKSFVRQYAAFLGLDAEELASEVQRTLEPQLETAPFPEKPKPDVPVIQLEFGDDWRSVDRRPASWPSWIFSGALLVGLMLVCSGVYWFWWERPHHQVLVREIPPAPRIVPAPQPAAPAPQPLPNQDPAVPAAAPVTPSAVSQPDTGAAPAAPPAAVSSIPVSAPDPNAAVRVGITAEERVWISAVVNGKFRFSGILEAHQSRNIDADGPVVLRLGNAGGATITWNGKPVGSVGLEGQVRTVQFTSGGFQIVSSKPVDPPDRL
jgi:cytoskeleton protein RodZ